MSRGGYVVDTAARTVGGPGGELYALDHLEVAGAVLFYARQIPDDPLITYQETWLIASRHWAITRFTFHEQLRPGAIDWKMEPDPIQIYGQAWHVADGYLDLDVYEGFRYDLEDAGDLADAITVGEIPLTFMADVLRAIDSLCLELRHNGYSGQRILDRYAPGLRG